MSVSTLEQLDKLHTLYVEAVNEAVADDRPVRVRQLAKAYDVDSSRILRAALGLEEDSRRAPVLARAHRRLTRHRNAA